MLPLRSIARLPRIAWLISTSIVSTLIVACGGGGGGPGNTPPPSPPLTLQPTSATLGAGTTQKFAASGGQQPYSYSVLSGNGTVDSTGLFTAPASAGAATVRVMDAAGASATASVTINGALAMNAGSITMTASSGQSFQFSGVGGSGSGYQYTLVSGSGTISAGGLYSVGNSAGRNTVQVRDSQGTTATSTVEVLRIRTNGVVNSIAANGSALYLAGSFSAVNPYLTSQMAVLDPSSGKPQLQCDVNTGFDAPVYKILLVNNALYVGGVFTSYKGQPAYALAKLDATTCALDTTFTQSMGFGGGFPNNPSLPPGPTWVEAIAASGSSLFIAGSFTTYRGQPAQGLAKLDLQTGALDQSFTATTGADGPLWELAISADSVYFAGSQSHYRGTFVGSEPVKLDINSGALDPAFHPPTRFVTLTGGLLYSGTSLYVAGETGASLNDTTVVKLDAGTGAQDTAFAAPSAYPGRLILGMAASGQSLYVSGRFTAVTGEGPLTNVLKLDAATGRPDNAFNQAPALDYPVLSLAISGSSLYLVGGFHLPGSQHSLGILKLDAATGTPDSVFGLNPGFGGTPFAVAVGASMVYVGGAISGYGGAAASNVAKMDTTSGVPDAAFDMAAGTDGPVNKILISGSSLYLGGLFYYYGGVPSGLIAKADANTGAPDSTFMQGGGFTFVPQVFWSGVYSASVNALALSGTSLYVGGHFTDYRGQTAGELAKIDASSGDLDATFVQGQGFIPSSFPGNSPPDSAVMALAVTQNALYVAGDFYQYRGVTVGPLLKLDLATGAVDTAFTPPVSAPFQTAVNMALLVSGNNLYVGFPLTDTLGGTGLCKLDAASGAVDTTFTMAVALSPRGTALGAVAVVSDLVLSGSSLYVAGDFARDLGARSPGPANNLIKVDAATGALDTTFSQPGGPNGAVNSLLLEGSTLYIGGSFSSYLEKPATFSAALDPASGANQDVAAF
jgi:hypothetical protein